MNRTANSLIPTDQGWKLFVIIPVFANVMVVGAYFSQISFAQQIVAPTIEGLNFRSWRELGLLESLQHLTLLVACIVAMIAVIHSRSLWKKALFACACAGAVFCFLEEIDYGVHYYNYFIVGKHGEHAPIENWHNESTNGRQNVSYLKLASNLVIIGWFVVAPMITLFKRNLPFRTWVPAAWFSAAFGLTFLFSLIAHQLEAWELSTINGVKGNLESNISEFRELNSYYLLTLYLWQTGFRTGEQPAGLDLLKFDGPSEDLDDDTSTPLAKSA